MSFYCVILREQKGNEIQEWTEHHDTEHSFFSYVLQPGYCTANGQTRTKSNLKNKNRFGLKMFSFHVNNNGKRNKIQTFCGYGQRRRRKVHKILCVHICKCNWNQIQFAVSKKKKKITQFICKLQHKCVNGQNEVKTVIIHNNIRGNLIVIVFSTKTINYQINPLKFHYKISIYTIYNI